MPVQFEFKRSFFLEQDTLPYCSVRVGCTESKPLAMIVKKVSYLIKSLISTINEISFGSK